MVEYLEGVHQREFITGTIDYVHHNVNNGENSDGYQPPTHTLPEPPPLLQESQMSRVFSLLVPWYIACA